MISQPPSKAQKLGVLDYCNCHGIASIGIVEDVGSGRMSWKDRQIARSLKKADASGVLIAADVLCVAQSTLLVLQLLQTAA